MRDLEIVIFKGFVDNHACHSAENEEGENNSFHVSIVGLIREGFQRGRPSFRGA
jgi:hypothetical protein